MKKLTIMVAALVACAWLGATTARAEAKAEKKDAPAKKADAENKAPAKKDAPDLSTILKEDELALLQKKYSKLVKDRQEIEVLQAEYKALKDTEDPKELKKAERKLPLVYKKLTQKVEVLQAEAEKALKPLNADWDRLKDQDARLTTAEANTKDADKLKAEREALTAQEEALDKIRTALTTLSDVKVEKIDEKAKK